MTMQRRSFFSAMCAAVAGLFGLGAKSKIYGAHIPAGATIQGMKFDSWDWEDPNAVVTDVEFDYDAMLAVGLPLYRIQAKSGRIDCSIDEGRTWDQFHPGTETVLDPSRTVVIHPDKYSFNKSNYVHVSTAE